MLISLEEYERTLQVKRKILPSDLARLGALNMPEAPLYVPAMIKTLLNAPGEMVSNGHADVFSSTDISGLSNLSSKARSNAGEADKLMSAAKRYLEAYSHMDELTKLKLTSDFEIRCVMHVHGKKVATRKEFPSLLHVAEHFHNECKSQDGRLPVWRELDALQKNDVRKQTSGNPSMLREIREDGSIPDSELDRLHMVKHACVKKRGEDAGKLWIIHEFNGESVLLKEKAVAAPSTAPAEAPKEREELSVPRATLVSQWVVDVETVEEAK